MYVFRIVTSRMDLFGAHVTIQFLERVAFTSLVRVKSIGQKWTKHSTQSNTPSDSNY